MGFADSKIYQLTVLTLELTSPTLPPGKTIVLDLTDPTKLDTIKKDPVTIKEGVEYKSVHPLHVKSRD